jgi:DNA-directed RNA polymerase sigma subunit (sigma70/sigma32)
MFSGDRILAPRIVGRDMKRHAIAQGVDTGLNKYLAEIGRIPLLTAEQELALAAKVRSGDKAARDQRIVQTCGRS